MFVCRTLLLYMRIPGNWFFMPSMEGRGRKGVPFIAASDDLDISDEM